MNMSGRNAFVTGVSRRAGIGYAIARRLLEAGASVFVQGWTEHDATQPWGSEPGGTEAVARELDVPFAEVDFADPAAPREVSQQLRRRSDRSTSSSSIMRAAAAVASPT